MRRAMELRVERLEGRRLLAGDVTIIDNSFGSTLEIIGDDAANFLVVEQVPSSTFSGTRLKISGLSTADGPTTINGSSNPFFIETYNYDGEIRIINASLGGGDDLMFFEDAAIPADVNIDTGAGNDDIEFTAVQIGAVNITGEGVDDLTIDYFYSIGDISMTVDQLGDVDIIDARLDNGLTLQSLIGNSSVNDNVSVVDTDISDDLNITLDRGGRAWITDGSNGGSITVNTLRSGARDINIENHRVAGNVSIVTKSGADQIHLGNQTITGSVNVVTGGGADNVTFDSLTVDRGNLFVNTGGGADTLYVENGIFQDSDIRTGSGNDAVTIFDAIYENDAELRTGSGNDNVLISGLNVAGNLDIWTSRGNDFVQALGGSYSALNIRMGADSDTLEAGQVSVSQASVWNGGGGSDTFEPLADNLGPISISSFETGNRPGLSNGNVDMLDDEIDLIDRIFATR